MGRIKSCLPAFVFACIYLLAGPVWAAQTVRVGIYQNSPKLGYTAAGKPEGMFIDVIEAIASKEGWTLQYVPGSFGEGMARLAAGEIDLMPDVALTSEREGSYAFGREMVLSSWNQVYARRGSGIRSLVDLDGKRVAVVEGSMQQDYIRQTASAFAMIVTLVPLPDFAAAFQAVAQGRADAVVTNRFYGVRHAAASDLEDTSIIFNPSRLYFAAPRTADRALLDAIDKHLIAFKSDSGSVYYRSIAHWTAGDERIVVPPWLKWAAPVAALLLLVSWGWAVILRRTARRLQESELRQRDLATERRRLLDEVQIRADALERSSQQLALARDAAQAADRIKSAFLATMSHELRTPLNSIIGFTGIVLQGMAGPVNAEQAKQLGMVRESARHLLALINDVLDISRIEAGELSVGCAPFDLAASIRKVTGIVEPLAARKGLELSATVAHDVHAMTGDARRVEQILLNLLGNAVKFTQRGHVALDVALVGQWQAGPGAGAEPQTAVRMRVTDTGIGIREEDMALLFRPFRQVDSALSRNHDGTGLGLAICERLVGLMGGKISLDSVWQQGSVFEVILPLSPQRAQKAQGSA
ncbi:transporter substrate-binding domain-containing protein [Caenimonas sp. SL110]|uniref:ATP-binding protein n=1 Tax=Caenimonas sp. SL110 TaxID=1450524 RepID=UPI0006543D1A|nr:transporter substrate-binding domain-containing protein [Caenimonas sp. SL110]